MEADIEIKAPKGSAVVRVMHAGGGSSYAYCFDDETEILTMNRGWQSFCDLKATDKVATLNQNSHSFEWQKPTEIISMPYDGEMVHFKSRTVDMMVTPNHRMYARRYPGAISRKDPRDIVMPQKAHPTIDTNWKFIEAEELRQNHCRQRWQFKTNCNGWKGKEIEYIEIPEYEPKKYGHSVKHIGVIPIDLMIELAGWFVTEGHIDKKVKQINLCQDKEANPENWELVKDVCERLGLGFWNGGRNEKDFAISSKELSLYFKENFGATSYEKKIPTWMKNLPKDKLQKLLDICILGDGWIANKSFGYKSFSKQLRTDISEIALKCGYGVSEHKETVNIRCVQNEPTINDEPLLVPYNRDVFCVTVPNSIVLTKRNGKSCWSGNSYAAQKLTESFQGGEKPSILIIGHYHKFDYCYSRSVHCLQPGATQDQSRFMRKKRLASHVGFCVVKFQQDINGSVTKFCPEFFPFFDKGYYLNRDGAGERIANGADNVKQNRRKK